MSDEELNKALAVVSGDTSDAVVPDSIPAARDAITDYDNQLIADLVANLRKPEETLRHYGLTKDDIAAKARNPEWAARYREMLATWNSNTNLRERIRAKAAYLLEDSLVPLFKIISGNSSHASKLEAIEKLIKISTVAHVPKEAEHHGEPRRIIINIGGTTQPVIISTEREKVDAALTAPDA